MYMKYSYIILFSIFSLISGNNTGRPITEHTPDPFRMSQAGRIGDNPFPTNPMSDRARGYLLPRKSSNSDH